MSQCSAHNGPSQRPSKCRFSITAAADGARHGRLGAVCGCVFCRFSSTVGGLSSVVGSVRVDARQRVQVLSNVADQHAVQKSLQKQLWKTCRGTGKQGSVLGSAKVSV